MAAIIDTSSHNLNDEAYENTLKAIAHTPKEKLLTIATPKFFQTMPDASFMRIATLLAQKSYDEDGCPIGGVVIDNETRQIIGKGHNTLVQDGDVYNHGETSAMRDAGRIDFSTTTIFTTLSPCDVCAALIYMRGIPRVVVGDVTNASGNEDMLRSKGIQVDILEDPKVLKLYAKYCEEKPDQNLEDWKGKAAVNKRLREQRGRC